MTRDEIIKMAQDSRVDVYGAGKYYAGFLDALVRFCRMAQAAEREACAQVCDELGKNDDSFYAEFSRSEDCAEAIRAREVTE